MRRIDELTDAQQAVMVDHAQKWITIGQQTGEADWEQFEVGARACYGYAGIDWPARVVRVPSPLVLSLAAPMAAYLLALKSGDAVGDSVSEAINDAVSNMVGDAADDVIGGSVRDEVSNAVGDAVIGAVRDAVGNDVGNAVGGVVNDVVNHIANHVANHVASNMVGVEIRDAVGGPVGGPDGDAVYDAVHGAVDGAVHGSVHSAVDDAVINMIGDAIDDVTGDVIGGTVSNAVRDSVRGAVGKAIRNALSQFYYCRLVGQWGVSWSAQMSFFRDECGIYLAGDLWDRDRAYAQAQSSAGWWWPHREFVMVADRPRVLHLEQVSSAGWGSHRLHCETGPAITWADGWVLYYWQGTRVPQALIEGRWTTDDILREPNAEIRRCAIERMGWDRFIDAAGLLQAGPSVPDPGNPGYELALYDVPEQIYDEPVRVLLCTNATDERDGTRRRFGLTVPADIADPITAAAWTFDLNPSTYAQLSHAY